jgi:hypothetical protein
MSGVKDRWQGTRMSFETYFARVPITVSKNDRSGTIKEERR